MKVRAMRVRARPGQRRMVARHKWNRALDDFAAGAAQAFSEALCAQAAARQFIDGMLREWIKPIVAEVVQAAQPNGSAIGGATSSRFAVRDWS